MDAALPIAVAALLVAAAALVVAWRAASAAKRAGTSALSARAVAPATPPPADSILRDRVDGLERRVSTVEFGVASGTAAALERGREDPVLPEVALVPAPPPVPAADAATLRARTRAFP